MAQKNKAFVIIMFLLITLGISGGIYWRFSQKIGVHSRIILFGMTIFSKNKAITSGSPLPPPPFLTDSGTFSFPKKVPPGTIIRISSSIAMVLLNQALKNSFEQQFLETQVIVNTQASDESIDLLLKGSIDIAAISRHLSSYEESQGLTALLMDKNVLAMVIGAQNYFRDEFKEAQVVDSFQGKIINCLISKRSPGATKVINHPSVSSTRHIFEQLILKGRNCSNTPNITTTTQETIASVLQNLGIDSISHETYLQITNQQAVRVVPIDYHTLEVPKYPYRRSFYYVYRKPSSEAVKIFLGYVFSPMGEKIISDIQ
ncbi:MAG: phosphate ABC transporter substrate-binding protein [cyanobacterium endosymbiont of Epithemia adnata isolate EadnSB Bon19]|jgi:phosphate transport system substrate-binding protein